MATFVLKDASFKIGASSAALVDLSSFVTQIQVTYSAEQLDATVMGSSNRIRKPGLKDATARVTMFQDYTASKVDATLWPLVGSTGCFIRMKPQSSASTGINPSFDGAFVLASYSPLDGGVGAMNTVNIDFQGNGVLHRHTTAT